MGFNRLESRLRSRVAKACLKGLQNLKNRFRPKKNKAVQVSVERENFHGMYKAPFDWN